MVILSTDDLQESIRFYTEVLGFPLRFRDGAHFAALDGGSARAIDESGGGVVKGPYNDARERRAVVYDNKGNGLVFYKSLPR